MTTSATLYCRSADEPVESPIASLALAGVPYGVFDAGSTSLWWSDEALDLLCFAEQCTLETYLSTVAQGRSTLHGCVLGGRLEPAGAPRLGLAISAHPQVPSRTVVVLTPRPAAPHPFALDRLTRRERAVADLIAHGESTKSIAGKLDISEHTVRRHTEHLFTKLGVRTRAAVAARVAGSTV